MSHRGDPIPIPDRSNGTKLPRPDPVDLDHPIVSQANRIELEDFGELPREDYRSFKEELLAWLASYGKNPIKQEGLALSTLRNTHYKLEIVYRWKWRENGYTTDFTPKDADDYLELQYRWGDIQDSSLTHHVKAIKRLFLYKNHTEGTNYEWDCPYELSQKNGDERKYLRKSYFRPLYQAALDFGSVTSYYNKNLTDDERDRLKAHLAQRLEIPKEHVGPEEFKRANSWKVPSMIGVTLDTGLRPVEVGRAKTTWVNSRDGELNVPKNESTKNEAHWNCSLSQKTVTALEKWQEERSTYLKYRETDALWLTKNGNPYGSTSCNRLLRKLMSRSSTDFPDDITWYSIRHGVATYWANEVGIHHAKEQLRHESVQTTLKYLHSDPDTRGYAARSMW